MTPRYAYFAADEVVVGCMPNGVRLGAGSIWERRFIGVVAEDQEPPFDFAVKVQVVGVVSDFERSVFLRRAA